jgi:hypothetical protein
MVTGPYPIHRSALWSLISAQIFISVIFLFLGGIFSPSISCREWECEYVALEVRRTVNQLFWSRLFPDSVEDRSSEYPDGVAIRRVL